MNGYTGNILHVDLTSKQLVIENTGAAFIVGISVARHGDGYILGICRQVWRLRPANVLTMMVSATGVPILVNRE